MWYQSLLIPAMVITIYCHTPRNNSDVIVTYSGHSEAFAPVPKPVIPIPETATSLKPDFAISETTSHFGNDETESVVFIPNDRPVSRIGDEYLVSEDKMSVGDILTRGKSISDIMNDKKMRLETEPPNQDILFISGKNNENENTREEPTKKEKTRRSGKETKKEKRTKLDCKRLDCNNTVNSVCGGKMEHKQWRYRLFLNECYFRKVNCNFKYEENRFKMVERDLCRPIAAHYSERPFVYKIPSQRTFIDETTTPPPMKRRAFSSRRSQNVDVKGQSCSHPCPADCPDHYEPECAMSSSGVRRVFMNHCKLDFNSCSYGAVWHRRSLAECVGGKKADLNQNSAFIGWMQRVGIVDTKGRLNLE